MKFDNAQVEQFIPSSYPVSTGIFPHCPNGRLGQDLGFGGFAFALKLPELLNTTLPTVRTIINNNNNYDNLYGAVTRPYRYKGDKHLVSLMGPKFDSQ